MANYSISDSSYQTLNGYKNVWCYQKELVLRRIQQKRGLPFTPKGSRVTIPKLQCRYLNDCHDVSNHLHSVVCAIVCSGAVQRKHQSSAPLVFVRGTHWWPVDSLTKTSKMFPFDDVIMLLKPFVIDVYTKWTDFLLLMLPLKTCSKM